MELVYLWVEEYKNIENQGFNFSPRFECDFDGENLTIDKKEDYISIFPDNVNVTAIVGENGSGKSSLFEVFSNIQSIYNHRNFKFLLVVEKEDIYIYSNIDYLDYSRYHRLGSSFFSYFKTHYLNISHLERDNIIKNDAVSVEDPIIYHGIYGKNNFERDDTNSIHFCYDFFSPTRFDFFQTYTLTNLLKEKEYDNLLFQIFNIEKPDYLKLEYSIEELKKPHIYLSKEFEFFLSEPNADIIELNDKNKLKKFFTLCSNAKVDITKYIKLNFTTSDLNKIKFSSGEKVILYYLERIDYMINKINIEGNDSILLFDEIELFLHPSWQKKIFKVLIDFIQKKHKSNKKLHIIINSHSPFILSDIPKDNILFLDKYTNEDIEVIAKKQKIGNCKILKNYSINNTFGANIHTLLSDGFFMEDGLMGEFAKEKIEEIKKFYDENKDLKQEDNDFEIKKLEFKEKINVFRHIQSIIGEPFLQTVIKNYLDELEQIFDNENFKKKRIEEFIKEFGKDEIKVYLESKNDETKL